MFHVPPFHCHQYQKPLKFAFYYDRGSDSEAKLVQYFHSQQEERLLWNGRLKYRQRNSSIF